MQPWLAVNVAILLPQYLSSWDSRPGFVYDFDNYCKSQLQEQEMMCLRWDPAMPRLVSNSWTRVILLPQSAE